MRRDLVTLPSQTPDANATRPTAGSRPAVPLYVDMDGTLLATDTLWELFVRLIKTAPSLLWHIPFWLLKGRAYLKQQLTARLTLDPAALPYNRPVIEFLSLERQREREIILATASDRLLAERVAHQVGLFSAVLASDGTVNLAGERKLSAILQHAGGGPFDYIGNSSDDLPIWRHAERALLVRPSRRVRAERRASAIDTVLCHRPSIIRGLLRVLRVPQWSKNVLLVVPLVLAHEISDVERLVKAILAFATFTLSASAVYIVNDLLDLDSDRRHPYKRFRPLAAGALSIPAALAIVPICISLSVAIAVALLPGLFAGTLLLYIATTTLYSLWLKRVVILDVFVLAGLYTFRVLAGAVATNVSVSPWFLAFSMFFFLSLAFVKRYAELRFAAGKTEDQDYLAARGYLIEDLELLKSVGAASGYLAVAVLALYINSPEVHVLYRQPVLLWLIGPLLLFWITRVWLLAHRGCLHTDPVVFALTDRPSYVLAASIAALLIVASMS
jgi:4-hydroxybenzoate polyprenyltransferase